MAAERTGRCRNVLVVDDDEGVRSFLHDYLSENGFNVLTVPGGRNLPERVANGAVDLVVLDLSLPDGDGIVFARELRARSDVPIIILTGRGGAVDCVVGLEVGADDYVAKPFSARELLARIRSVLRRSSDKRPKLQETVNPRKQARFAGWTLDLSSRRLISEEGVAVRLTPRQFDLLSTFLSHPNQILGRDQLLDHLSTGLEESFDRSVDVQVMRLRRKIEKDPKRPELITTIRTGGYIFTADVDWS